MDNQDDLNFLQGSKVSFAKELVPINLTDEMKKSYLSYAMSVIVGRALPDVRDGLKPVHRRILYAMHELGNAYNKPYKKSARVVGDVIGKYHPHGDSAVYDATVRMAQNFSLRYTLVDGQGNFGSVDGDSPAAMRYTEVRMSKIAHQLIVDLEKETVNFRLNYDESEREPCVLPTLVPNLLINGSSGIAVGMATNIPPHNLTEVVNATLKLIDNLNNPNFTTENLLEFLPAPDFPTGGILSNLSGAREAYLTGRGKVILTAVSTIELNKKEQQVINITEIPYQVNKANLIEKIANLVKNEKIEGISAIRDESDKDGMSIVIEVKKSSIGEVVLNNLYKLTDLQASFNFNMVALVDGAPKILNLKEILDCFIAHRREVVTRRSIYDLRKSRERAHILEGLTIALNNIDKMIEMIKSSTNVAMAKSKLMQEEWLLGSLPDMLLNVAAEDMRLETLEENLGVVDNKYHLSETQAQAILDMKLQKLTGLEQDKIISEYKEVVERIFYLLNILRNPDVLISVIKDELEEVKSSFGDDRKTTIDNSIGFVDDEDLIPNEERIVTMSNDGYIKAQSIDEYRTQKRGGRGKSSTNMKQEDEISQIFIVNSHATLLCFSSLGRVYWKKTYQIPLASRGAKGRPMINFLPLEESEKITSILPIRNFDSEYFVFMATEKGTAKKVSLELFSRPRANGIIAIDLNEGDKLIATEITNGSNEIMLFSNSGKAIRFKESNIRSMGRTARGVRAMNLAKNQYIVNMQVAESDKYIFCATENGFGKLSPTSEFSTIKRGGKGVIAINTSVRNGEVVASYKVDKNQEAVLITNMGTLVRIPLNQVAISKRSAQGVKLINLSGKDEKLVSVAVIAKESEDLDLNTEILSTDDTLDTSLTQAKNLNQAKIQVENNLLQKDIKGLEVKKKPEDIEDIEDKEKTNLLLENNKDKEEISDSLSKEKTIDISKKKKEKQNVDYDSQGSLF